MKERYKLFMRYWIFFMFLSLIIGFSFYSQNKLEIITGTALVTFVYTLFAWLLSDELTHDSDKSGETN